MALFVGPEILAGAGTHLAVGCFFVATSAVGKYRPRTMARLTRIGLSVLLAATLAGMIYLLTMGGDDLAAIIYLAIVALLSVAMLRIAQKILRAISGSAATEP